MNNKIENTISAIKTYKKNQNMEAILKIKSSLETFAKDPEMRKHLENETQNSPKGLELYRDGTQGFVLLSYSEEKGTYRSPHNHGGAWVIYVVVSGEVEMGNYFEARTASGSNQLIQKNKERLMAGDVRIYLPGEIHDTHCLSAKAIIIRLTSLDLKEEERSGRMKRFQI